MGDGSEPAPSLIYTLSKLQYDVLAQMVAEGTVCSAHIDSLPTDPPNELELSAKERKDFDELVTLGILKDVSANFVEGIEASKLNNNGRGYKVYCMTEHGVHMFMPQFKGSEAIN